MRALVIKKPWPDKILAGTKTWEIRGSRTNIRGTVGLIESRSGTVVGVCEVVDCVGPLTAEEFRRNARKAGREENSIFAIYSLFTFALWVCDVRVAYGQFFFAACF